MQAQYARMASDKKKQKAGAARWSGVSESDKKSLVSRAAHARWRANEAQIRVAAYRGTVNLAGITLDCAVLDDGTRVLSERSVAAAVGHERHPADYERKQEALIQGADVLPSFLTNPVAEFLPPAARAKLANPIRYQVTKGFGIPAIGIEATSLADICEAFLTARDKQVLPPDAVGKADAADRLMRALARVALVALIDEATGFQVARDRDALQKLLEQYVSEEHRPWMQKFPNEFYIELFRLRNLKTDDVKKRPQYFGMLTNDIVYDRLLPGMLPRLEEVNPSNDKGRRARKHHQHIVGQGEEHLRSHLAGLVYLMRSSSSWTEFKKALDRAAPVQRVDNKDVQIALPNPEGGRTDDDAV